MKGPSLFQRVNRTALANLPAILAQLLPGGNRVGREYVVCNPRRADNSPGSFRVNLVTGHWADFAIRVGGGDPVSLVAYVAGLSQIEAARELAHMLGVPQ